MFLNYFQFLRGFVLSLAVISVILYGCKTTLLQDQPLDQVHALATQKLGTALDSASNSTREYVLYIQKASPASTTRHLRFLVIRVDNHEIVYEQSFNPGYAKWITDFSIEVLNLPGTLRENETLSNYKKTINISTLKY